MVALGRKMLRTLKEIGRGRRDDKYVSTKNIAGRVQSVAEMGRDDCQTGLSEGANEELGGEGL